MDYKLAYENLLQVNSILHNCLSDKNEQIVALEAQLVELRDYRDRQMVSGGDHQHRPVQTINIIVDDDDAINGPEFTYKLIKKDRYNHFSHKYQYMFVRWRRSRVTIAQQFEQHRYPNMKVLVEIGRSRKEVSFAQEVAHIMGQDRVRICYNNVRVDECDEATLISTVMYLRTSLLL